MINSRLGRSLMLGTGALAAGAIALSVAPAAMAAETGSNTTSSTATPGAAGQQGARLGANPDGQRPGGPQPGGPQPGGHKADGPYVGARLVLTRDGATVAHVVDGGPADVAGVDEGDIVSSIDGVALDHRGALREALDDAKAGDEITVVLSHNGSEENVVITLGSPEDRPAPPAAVDVPWVGARLVHLEGKDGVLVRSVAANGPADTAGLVKGDVVTSIDGDAVTDWWRAREVIAAHAPGDKVSVIVDRDGAPKTLTVTLGSLDDAVVRSHANGSAAPADASQGAPRGGHGPLARLLAGHPGAGAGRGGAAS